MIHYIHNYDIDLAVCHMQCELSENGKDITTDDKIRKALLSTLTEIFGERRLHELLVEKEEWRRNWLKEFHKEMSEAGLIDNRDGQ